MMSRKLMKVGLPLVAVALVLAVLLGVHIPRAAEPQAPAPRAPPPTDVRAEGRIVSYPGASVTVGTEVTGRLVELRVEEKSQVRKGEVIAELDATEQRAALTQARAQSAEIRTEVRRLQADLERYRSLFEAKAMSRQNFEYTQRAVESARARMAAAQAQEQRLESVLAKTRIRSPIDGVVISQLIQQGELITAGSPLVVVADLTRSRVEAEVDEFDTGKVVLGAPVRIMAEGFPGTSWKGTVEDIPNAVMNRRLKPQDPGRPVDLRVLLIKVSFDEPTPLKLGQRVELLISS
ncbi:NolF secretion protein [Cystobacter fuscus]|uniref:NolF secretion protein n=1 Tax=Cystobacter fuscus TaxID=43 RepID=A0A250IZK7_9BACT|nr:efflux RND transporter periplasmic adaptor subunit [Cystobacter fuscus]ATB37155.1 NolF secretion protein [Cystobacter fuscus]